MTIVRRFAFFSLAIFASISDASQALCLAPKSDLSVTPGNVTVVTKQTQQFRIMDGRSDSLHVKWSVSGVPGGNAHVGTISASGLYTAPSGPSNSSIVVSAVTASDGRLLASATVTLAEDPAIEQVHEEWLAGAASAAAKFG